MGLILFGVLFGVWIWAMRVTRDSPLWQSRASIIIAGLMLLLAVLMWFQIVPFGLGDLHFGPGPSGPAAPTDPPHPPNSR